VSWASSNSYGDNLFGQILPPNHYQCQQPKPPSIISIGGVPTASTGRQTLESNRFQHQQKMLQAANSGILDFSGGQIIDKLAPM
jgi:hypothetical protein